jgi:hypothetical protein
MGLSTDRPIPFARALPIGAPRYPPPITPLRALSVGALPITPLRTPLRCAIATSGNDRSDAAVSDDAMKPASRVRGRNGGMARI